MNNEPRPMYSDLFNARLFSALNKERIIWSRDYGGWFIYNGKYWQKDNNDVIKGYAIEAYEELSKKMREDGTDVAYNHMRRSGSNGALNAMIDCSKSMLGKDSEIFDRNPLLLNCNNYTIDLNSGSVYKQKQDDFITKKANVNYKLNENCLLWNKFLDEIFLEDKNIIDFIQRVLGYGLTALTNEQCMFILYGHGRNGKSIFLETIHHILGDYATTCPSTTFIQKQNPGIPNDVARLKGARFTSASETNQNVNIDEELIKQLTGNKTITARFLNKEFFEFNTTFKIFLATNHKPNIRGTDTGIWRRIKMIPFQLDITEENEDRELGKKLISESSGILNWMIEGYNKWAEIGLATPEKVRRATQLYREEEDDLGQFIKNECVIEKCGILSCNDFKSKFKEIMGYPKGAKALSEYMARNGHKPSDDNRYVINGKQQRGYVGIRWATEMDRIPKEDLQWKE